jgi:hypothetical protein
MASHVMTQAEGKCWHSAARDPHIEVRGASTRRINPPHQFGPCRQLAGCDRQA